MGMPRISKGRLLRCAIVVLILACLFFTALAGIALWERHFGEFSGDPQSEKTLSYGGKEYVFRDGIETFLVMGLDKAGEADSYNNDQQADFLMLFVFDNVNGTCTALHINRDTMAEMNVLGVAGNPVDTVTKQIALAHTYGNGRDVSCRNVADAVTQLLFGAKVNHYLSIAMDSVPTINDLVGGVTVELLEDFTFVDPAMVKGETLTLKGEQSLHYVRTRYGLEDSTNATRMERQHQYLNALLAQAKKKNTEDETFLVNAALELDGKLISDRSVNQLQELARKIMSYETVEIRELTGETRMGEKFLEFYPTEDSVKQLTCELFCKIKDTEE